MRANYREVTFCELVREYEKFKESDSKPGPAIMSIDVSQIREVLEVGKSLLGVNCFQQPIVEAYQA